MPVTKKRDKPVSGPKILLIDLETTPIGAHVYGLFDQNVGLSGISEEWSIYSVACQWLGDTAVAYHDTFEQADRRDDRALCQTIWGYVDKADIVIAHNGRAFDMKKVRARMLMHGLPPPAPVRVYDTLLVARRVAKMTSNKLAWLSKYLASQEKIDHAEFPGVTLALEFLRGNSKARRVNHKYNVRDITTLKDVYLALRPYDNAHPNLGVYAEDPDKPACPRCASQDMKEDGLHHTNVSVYQRFRCNSCGSWSRGRKAINTKQHRAAQLASI